MVIPNFFLSLYPNQINKVMPKVQKLAQRIINANGMYISIGLTGNVGYISIADRNLYPDDDSRSERINLNYHTMMTPCMTREQLKDLHIAIGEVLKNSK